MVQLVLKRKNIQGKTYSLFGRMPDTEHFYDQLEKFVNNLITSFGNPEQLLPEIVKASKRKKYLKAISKQGIDGDIIGFILKNSKPLFSVNTSAVHEHLQNLPLNKCFDRTLTTSEEQLYLYLVEIELTNRIFREKFLAREYKIAFLPHCLRDLAVNCMSVPDETDYFCQGCSKHCHINAVSRILKDNQIEPYIWLTANLNKSFRQWKKKNLPFGVLGIACIPELVKGMRMCRKNKLPVIGIPLDANRCARWMGEFHENSVDIEKLKQLLEYTH